MQESPPESDDALNTMYNVIGRGLIDRENPTNSLLLLKPLNVVMHAGGKKFDSTAEQTYQDYLAWIREICRLRFALGPRWRRRGCGTGCVGRGTPGARRQRLPPIGR